MKTVDPNPIQFMDILSEIPEDKPVVMVNFLKYRDKAKYKDGKSDCTGREAYARYAKTALEKLNEIGATVIFMGSVSACLIAPPEEQWHDVFLVRYPSVAAFSRMISMPDYITATAHRTAALEDSRLIASL
jgi:uncharacterized protein (DUF1330 family)